jgi:transposase-like protein
MRCHSCDSENLQKRGIRNNKQRYECQDCGTWMVDEIDEVQFNKVTSPVLIFDIETSIRHAFLFGTGDQYIKADDFEDEPMVLGWAAKYAGDSQVMSDFVSSTEAKNKNQYRVVKSLWDLLSTVNLSASYNGNNFDVKYMNTFFIKYRLGLPNRIRNIDPCVIARNTFRFDSNKMDYVVKYLGLDDGKHKMERKDWIDCYYGVIKSLNKMESYCRHDVEILELVLDAVKPYVPALPNMGIFGDVESPVCPSCGSLNFVANGNQITSFGRYNSYRCECQALFRSRTNLLSKDKRKSLRAF